jgi:hypothetical protein
MIAYLTDYCIDYQPAYLSIGISQDAKEILRKETSIKKDDDLSRSFNKMELWITLFDAYAYCYETNWDGNDAKAVMPESLGGALKFIGLIPQGFPMPEITVSPTGKMVVEWFKEQGFILSITVLNESKIYYNALFGNEEAYGTENFEDYFPNEVLHNILRLYNSPTEF